MNEMFSRVLWGLVFSGGLAALSWGLALVTVGGALAGLAVGLAVFVGTGPEGFVCLGSFFVIGSVLTRVGYQRKAERGMAEPRGGARGAWEVLAKGGVAALAALASLSGMTVFQIGFVGALAAALGDTASTELGQLSRGRSWLLVPLKRVKPGTPGAVSALGCAGGVGGSLAIAGLALVLELVSPAGAVAAAAGGFLGNLLESVITSATKGRVGHYYLNLVTTGVGAVAAVLLWSILV